MYLVTHDVSLVFAVLSTQALFRIITDNQVGNFMVNITSTNRAWTYLCQWKVTTVENRRPHPGVDGDLRIQYHTNRHENMNPDFL